MFENDSDLNNSPSQNNDRNNSYIDYLRKAAQASGAGDDVLGLHLYLAAYERAVQGTGVLDPAVITGLREAWQLACRAKERSLAEYIFEKLEPYLSSDEIAQCAAQLQRLALDKLEEFGLSREDLEDMTDMISQDFFGMDPASYGLRVEKAMSSPLQSNLLSRGLIRSTKGDDFEHDAHAEVTADLSVQEGETEGRRADNGETPQEAVDPSAKEHAFDALSEPDAQEAFALKDGAQQTEEQANPDSAETVDLGMVRADESEEDSFPERMTYKDLIGYETVIDVMRKNGIGVENDPLYRELVQTLNARHGLSKTPITDIFLFRSAVREDASQFMMATLGEIELPAIRMRMEENLQGMPVLVVMASSEKQSRFGPMQNPFENGGVLILEDIDLWGSPLSDLNADESNGFMQVQLSRGAREALNLIRSSVENPDVYILVSAARGGSIDPFLLDLLEPLTAIDIDLPNAQERTDLWVNIAREHPSLRMVDRASLVKYSAGMSRYDIYMAAREGVEEAYKMSLSAREYVPVTAENIFEKIAAYQPLDSEQYHQMEDAIVAAFGKELDNIDSFLGTKKEE